MWCTHGMHFIIETDMVWNTHSHIPGVSYYARYPPVSVKLSRFAYLNYRVF
jgi:hypothetical protein